MPLNPQISTDDRALTRLYISAAPFWLLNRYEYMYGVNFHLNILVLSFFRIEGKKHVQKPRYPRHQRTLFRCLRPLARSGYLFEGSFCRSVDLKHAKQGIHQSTIVSNTVELQIFSLHRNVTFRGVSAVHTKYDIAKTALKASRAMNQSPYQQPGPRELDLKANAKHHT